MDITILLVPGAGWIYVSFQNPEQKGTLYAMLSRSRMDLCVLLDPEAEGVYVF